MCKGAKCSLPHCTFVKNARGFGQKRPHPKGRDRAPDAEAYMRSHPVCEDCDRARSAHAHHVNGRAKWNGRYRALCAVCHERRHLFGEAEQEARLLAEEIARA